MSSGAQINLTRLFRQSAITGSNTWEHAITQKAPGQGWPFHRRFNRVETTDGRSPATVRCCWSKNQRKIRESGENDAGIGSLRKAIVNLLMGCSVCQKKIGKKQNAIKSNVCKYNLCISIGSINFGFFRKTVLHPSKIRKSGPPASKLFPEG